MPARSTRILRRTAAVTAALTLAGAPVALARPADEALPSAASPQTASQPHTIVGHHVPDAISMQSVPAASPQQSNSDGGLDSTWLIVAGAFTALGIAGGLGVAKQRGALHMPHHAA
ncbi:MAG: hypothetical protein QOH43_2353 [Solirubrobacteraceae bacterium]|jgi:hypothetical protein|nr:hypothetical protein [Solirubrobacteraceae bacterium]